MSTLRLRGMWSLYWQSYWRRVLKDSKCEIEPKEEVKWVGWGWGKGGILGWWWGKETAWALFAWASQLPEWMTHSSSCQLLHNSFWKLKVPYCIQTRRDDEHFRVIVYLNSSHFSSRIFLSLWMWKVWLFCYVSLLKSPEYFVISLFFT